MTHPSGPSGPGPTGPSGPGPGRIGLFTVYARLAVALAALTWDVATDIRTAQRARKEFAGRRAA